MTTPNHYLQLTCFTMPGKVYGLTSAANPAQPAWQSCAFSLTDNGPAQETSVEGTGDWLSAYVPAEAAVRFLRVAVW